MGETAETIGSRLRALRRAKGWTQRELARRAGVGQPMIADLESGKRDDILAGNLRRLADALVVSVDQLLGRVSDPRPRPGEAPWLGRCALPQRPAHVLCTLVDAILARLRRGTQALLQGTNFSLACARQFWHHGNVPYFPPCTRNSCVGGVSTQG